MRHIPLGTIYISPTTKKNISAVLRSKRLSYGPFCQEFEQRFAELHDSTEGIFCNSGTSALHTILTALKIQQGWSDGDEVIIPIVTFVATVNAVIHAGLTPVFVDVDSKTYNLDPAQLASAVTKKTRAIMPVHVFGLPAAMDDITDFARSHSLVVVEDACEAIAARYKGRSVGSWGEATAFSTHSAHIITTGVGGMITTSNPELAELMRSLINHGRSSGYISIDDDDTNDSAKLRGIIAERFRFEEVGFSYRISEMEAAVGCSQLDDIETILQARQANTQALLQGLRPLQTWLQLPKLDNNDTVTLLGFPLVLTKRALAKDPQAAQKLVWYLEERGIETRPLLPIIGQPAYDHLHIKEEQFPVGAHITRAGMYFGCHQDLSAQDISYCVDTITSFFSEWQS